MVGLGSEGGGRRTFWSLIRVLNCYSTTEEKDTKKKKRVRHLARRLWMDHASQRGRRTGQTHPPEVCNCLKLFSDAEYFFQFPVEHVCRGQEVFESL